MLLDLGWRSLEQRRAHSRLTLLYRIHKGHVPIEASKHLRPMKCRSCHSHSNSFIPISTSSSSHRLSFYPRTTILLNGTVFPSLFLITMTLLLLNIPSLLSVTILSTNYFSCIFIQCSVIYYSICFFSGFFCVFFFLSLTPAINLRF